MLRNLSDNEKNAFFALIALHLPVEYRIEDALSLNSWSHEFLLFVLIEIDLNESYYEAYSVLVDKNYNYDEVYIQAKNRNISSFLSVLDGEYRSNPTNLIISLLILLFLKQKYDSRSRILIRNLLRSFCTYSDKLNNINIIVLEDYLITIIENLYQKEQEQQSKFSHTAENKHSTTNTMIRIAQISAVSLVAGGVIALTGGLAAPAIAALWGGFSFLTTAGVAVSIFGVTGAGLTGYKMMKRTKDLTEFSFESPMETQVNQMLFNSYFII